MVSRRGPPSSPQQDNILIDRLATTGTFVFQREIRGGGKQGDEMRQRGCVSVCGAYAVLVFVIIMIIMIAGLDSCKCYKTSSLGIV